VIYVSVEIVRFVCEHQPNIVEAKLVDAFGLVHFFVDKTPLFTAIYLNSDSQYPQPGSLECRIVAQSKDEDGRDLREINTLESTSEKCNFVVLANQLFEE
jgi:hypothetical protein